MSIRTEPIVASEVRLGEQVRRLRLRADLDQRDLARAANVSVGALQNLELGKGARITTLVRVLRALGSESWLDTLDPTAGQSPLAKLRGDAPARKRVRASRASERP